MRYKHSWHILEDDKEAYKKLKNDVTPLIEYAEKHEYIDPRGSTVNEDHILFRGPGEDFFWPNDATNDELILYDMRGYTGRDFSCETNKWPYDKIVCAILIRAKHHYKDKVKIRSSGHWYNFEWQKGKECYREWFGANSNDILEPKEEDEYY